MRVFVPTECITAGKYVFSVIVKQYYPSIWCHNENKRYNGCNLLVGTIAYYCFSSWQAIVLLFIASRMFSITKLELSFYDRLIHNECMIRYVVELSISIYLFYIKASNEGQRDIINLITVGWFPAFSAYFSDTRLPISWTCHGQAHVSFSIQFFHYETNSFKKYFGLWKWHCVDNRNKFRKWTWKGYSWTFTCGIFTKKFEYILAFLSLHGTKHLR